MADSTDSEPPTLRSPAPRRRRRRRGHVPPMTPPPTAHVSVRVVVTLRVLIHLVSGDAD
jgi:hypothetical protein